MHGRLVYRSCHVEACAAIKNTLSHALRQRGLPGTLYFQTVMTTGDRATVNHWDQSWSAAPRMRLPKPIFVSMRDRMNLLKKYVRPGMRYAEIGCAPGKLLAYAAAVLGAEVTGVDYSEQGIKWNRQLFDALNLRGDLRHEDIFATTLPERSFDVVHSSGVIEHFDDPSEMVRMHLKLTKPGGISLITIPNLTGFYKRFTSPAALAIHNLNVMNRDALFKTCPAELTESAEVFPFGRFSMSTTTIGHNASPLLRHPLFAAFDMIGFLQPFIIPALCPHLALVIRRK